MANLQHQAVGTGESLVGRQIGRRIDGRSDPHLSERSGIDTPAENIGNRTTQVHAGSIDQTDERREILALVARAPYPELELVERTENIDAQTERNRRLQNGNMIVETHVEPLDSADSRLVTIHLDDERE